MSSVNSVAFQDTCDIRQQILTIIVFFKTNYINRRLESLMIVRILENIIHPDERNADTADYTDSRGFEVSTSDISFLSFEKIALLKSGFLPKLNNTPTSLLVAFK